MSSNLKSFTDLQAWQICREFKIKIIHLAKSFPVDEKYKLVDQIVRSSRSVTNNIAEGFGRFHFQENIQFCRQARGSLFEILDHVICAYDEGYINNDQLVAYKNDFNNCLKLLNGYISYLNRAKKASKQ